MKYDIKQIAKLFHRLKGVYYPPSGKYYEFNRLNSGKIMTCENWDLPVVIEKILKEEE